MPVKTHPEILREVADSSVEIRRALRDLDKLYERRARALRAGRNAEPPVKIADLAGAAKLTEVAINKELRNPKRKANQ